MCVGDIVKMCLCMSWSESHAFASIQLHVIQYNNMLNRGTPFHSMYSLDYVIYIYMHIATQSVAGTHLEATKDTKGVFLLLSRSSHSNYEIWCQVRILFTEISFICSNHYSLCCALLSCVILWVHWFNVKMCIPRDIPLSRNYAQLSRTFRAKG